MTGRGIDQILPAHNAPELFEPYVKDARVYVALAEKRNGPIPKNVDYRYIWGEALEILDRTGLDVDHNDARDRAMAEQDHFSQTFRRGQLVRHEKFGLGRIVEVSDMGQHTRAVVEFNQAGRKTLILQYARLEPVQSPA